MVGQALKSFLGLYRLLSSFYTNKVLAPLVESSKNL